MGPIGGFLCLLAGLLLVLIFPWYNVAWLAWVAFVPLLMATRGMRWRTALLWGWISGCLGYLGILRWIPHTMINYGGIPTIPELQHLAALGALCRAVCRRVHGRLDLESTSMATGDGANSPGAMGRPEWVRAQAFSGFPWASLGYSQYLNRPLIQVADFASVYGVSFALVLGNVVIAQLLYGAMQRRWKGVRMPCALAVSSLAATSGYGGWRLHRPRRWLHPPQPT